MYCRCRLSSINFKSYRNRSVAARGPRGRPRANPQVSTRCAPPRRSRRRRVPARTRIAAAVRRPTASRRRRTRHRRCGLAGSRPALRRPSSAGRPIAGAPVGHAATHSPQRMQWSWSTCGSAAVRVEPPCGQASQHSPHWTHRPSMTVMSGPVGGFPDCGTTSTPAGSPSGTRWCGSRPVVDRVLLNVENQSGVHVGQKGWKPIPRSFQL